MIDALVRGIRNFFPSTKRAVTNVVHLDRKDRGESHDDVERRWPAARTDRLNQAHWAMAHGATINEDLGLWLKFVRERAEYEAGANPTIEGVVETHVTDVVGTDHPTLQVQSEDEAFNLAFEDVWREWWKMPDFTGQLSGTDLLQQQVRQLWTAGEYVLQYVTEPRPTGPVSLRILPIHPRRLATPPGQMYETALGVRRTREGRPLAYFIEDFWDNDLFPGSTGHFSEIQADQIIHAFKQIEPGQARGIPWLASNLQVAADLRDFDDQVLDAARAAADHATLIPPPLYKIDQVAINETTKIQRRQITALPPGYEVTQLKPEQPTTKYVEFREARLREIGRPVGMPLMMVMLDSAKHNYSSARFDGQIYQRGIRNLQSWMARTTLNRLANAVMREAILARAIPPAPRRFSFAWTWPTPPHVDPMKEAMAEQTRLQNGTLTHDDACAAHGKDGEQTREKLAREVKEFTASGLVHPMLKGSPPTVPDLQDDPIATDKPSKDEEDSDANAED